MLNNQEFDYLNTASTPTVDEVLSAAKFQVSTETSFWNIDVSQVLAAFGHMEACFQYSAKVLEIGPKLPSSWAWMGEVYIKRDDWHKAIEIAKGHIHRCLHYMCIAYSKVHDAINRLAACQRAFEVAPHCVECISRVLFHLHKSRQYEEYILFMKRFSEASAGWTHDWSQLDVSMNENPWPDSLSLRLTASSALAMNNIPFMIAAWSSAQRLARKEFETAGAACLDLSFAKIYKDLAEDKAKAVAIWKNVFDSFVDTRDGFPAMIKVLSTNSLAIYLLFEAIEVGVGTPEAEEKVAQLEGLSRRLNFTYKSELWVASYCQFFAPGVYYRLAGQDAKFQALFKPGLKQAVEML
ncbi:uncharacterized protein N7484_007510 [Penicillium longicatenatum]|uniref:uncharacterized protein n=1 Tax=Penicillium longicatenatum TaxID=1561947 RepID=UPI0025490D1D|nr:uncharacterized protein N7484_007510 [Penicillium longicatenatum]KAJ5639648.1 hypothetical protein N7484_007510 [Penicillium longicatenatum]